MGWSHSSADYITIHLTTKQNANYTGDRDEMEKVKGRGRWERERGNQWSLEVNVKCKSTDRRNGQNRNSNTLEELKGIFNNTKQKLFNYHFN